MKKILTLLLAILMILSLCACGESGENGEAQMEGLQVGFGREDITPNFSVGIGGYSDNETRRSEGFLDYIYSTCIAITEGETTILLFTIDNLAITQSNLNKLRESVSPATGVPAEHIYALGTHTHSAPSITTNDAEGQKYMEMFYAGAVTAAQAALEDRSGTTLYSAKTEIEGMNFVRHYLLENGTYAGSNFGDFGAAAIKEHATAGDPQMVLVKFDRADEAKQDILLVNWQAHPDHAKENGYTTISADFPGALRTKVEKDTGMLCAYFTGAAGNQNPDSRITEEMHNLSMKQYGEKLADHAIAALPNLTQVESSGIKTTQVNFEAEIDHSWDPMLSQANEVYDLWKSEGKAAGDALGKTYDFTSVYQARAIKTRASMAATQTLEINAFSVGGIGFTTGTYEMFSNAGLYVKANSPFETTVIMTGNSGYIPAEAAYDYRSYESDTGYFAKGTSEALAEKYVEMLKGLQ